MGKAGKSKSKSKRKGGDQAQVGANGHSVAPIKKQAADKRTAEQVFCDLLTVREEFPHDMPLLAERVAEFSQQLEKIPANIHAKLIKLAADCNDAEALAAVLRVNQFEDACLSLGALSKCREYLLCDESGQDRVKAKVKLRRAVLRKCDRLDAAALLRMIAMSSFNINDYHDVTILYNLIALLYQFNAYSEIKYLADEFFIHACNVPHAEMMSYCFSAGLLSDVKTTALTAKIHSPLSQLYFNRALAADKVKQKLLEQYAKLELDKVHSCCLLEILAIAIELDQQRISAEVSAELEKRADVSSAAELLLNADLIKVLNGQSTIFQRILTAEIKTKLILNNYAEEGSDLFENFNDELLQKELLKMMQNYLVHYHFSISTLHQRFGGLLFDIIEDGAVELQPAFVGFIMALFIHENDDDKLEILFANQAAAFVQLEENFTAEVVKYFNFPLAQQPLQTALMIGSKQCAAYLYGVHFSEIDENPELVEKVKSSAAEMLVAAFAHPGAGHANIRNFLRKDLVAAMSGEEAHHFLECYAQPGKVDRALLRSGVNWMTHLLIMPVFAFLSEDLEKESEDLEKEMEIKIKKFEDVCLALQAVAAKAGSDQYKPILDSALQQLHWLYLLQDPLRELDRAQILEVEQADLFEVAKSMEVEENKEELFVRCLFYAYKNDQHVLAATIEEIRSIERQDEAEEMPRVIKSNIIGLLCCTKQYDLVRLIFALMPKLNFAEDVKIENLLRPLSILCNQGELDLATAFIRYVGGQQQVLRLDWTEKHASPMYLAMALCVDVSPEESIKGLLDMDMKTIESHSDLVNLQLLTQSLSLMTSIDLKGKNERGRLMVKVTQFALAIKKPLLDVALAAQDGNLVYAALFQGHHNSVPVEKRTACLQVACFSPAPLLWETLKPTAAELQQKVSYPKQGYIAAQSRLNIMFAETEKRVLDGDLHLTKKYFENLALFANISAFTGRQYQLFFQLICLAKQRFTGNFGIGQDAIQQYVFILLVGEKTPLTLVNVLDKFEYLNLCRDAFKLVETDEHCDKISKFKRVLICQEQKLYFEDYERYENDELLYNFSSDQLSEEQRHAYVQTLKERVIEEHVDFDIARLLAAKNYIALAFSVVMKPREVVNLSLHDAVTVLAMTKYVEKSAPILKAHVLSCLHNEQHMGLKKTSYAQTLMALVQANKADCVDKMLHEKICKNLKIEDVVTLIASMCEKRFAVPLILKFISMQPNKSSLVKALPLITHGGHSPIALMSRFECCHPAVQKALDTETVINPTEVCVNALMQVYLASCFIMSRSDKKVSAKEIRGHRSLHDFLQSRASFIAYVRQQQDIEMLVQLASYPPALTAALHSYEIPWAMTFALQHDAHQVIAALFAAMHEKNLTFPVAMKIKDEPLLVHMKTQLRKKAINARCVREVLKGYCLLQVKLSDEQKQQYVDLLLELLRSKKEVNLGSLITLQCLSQNLQTVLNFTEQENLPVYSITLLNEFATRDEKKAVERLTSLRFQYIFSNFDKVNLYLKSAINARLARIAMPDFCMIYSALTKKGRSEFKRELRLSEPQIKILEVINKFRKQQPNGDFSVYANKEIASLKKQLCVELKARKKVWPDTYNSVKACDDDLDSIKTELRWINEQKGQLNHCCLKDYDLDSFAFMDAELNIFEQALRTQQSMLEEIKPSLEREAEKRAEEEQRKAEERAAEEKRQQEAQRKAAERAAEEKRQQEAKRKAAERAAEEKRQQAEAQRKAEERAAEEKRQQEEAQRKAAEREAEEKRQQEEQRKAAERAAEEKRQQEEAQRKAAERAAEEKRQQEEAQRKAAERAAQAKCQQAKDPAAKINGSALSPAFFVDDPIETYRQALTKKLPYYVKSACMPYVTLNFNAEFNLYEIHNIANNGRGDAFGSLSQTILYLSAQSLYGCNIKQKLAIAFDDGQFKLISATFVKPIEILSFNKGDLAILFQDSASKVSLATRQIILQPHVVPRGGML